MIIFQSLLVFKFVIVFLIVCLAGFLLFKRSVGGKYLDGICSWYEAQKLVKKLNQDQAKKHLFVTIYFDSAYPLCYGYILAYFSIHVGCIEGFWPLIPSILAVLFDYCENVTHIVSLKSGKVPRLKPLCSILKWNFFTFAAGYPVLSFLGNYSF